MRLADSGAEAAEAVGRRASVLFPYVVKHGATQILEPQLLNWLRVGVQFDGGQVEPERGESQRRLVDVKAGDLSVEDVPQGLGIRAHVIVAPAFGHQFAEGRDEEYPSPGRRVQDARFVSYAVAAESVESASNQHVGDDTRSVVASLFALLVRGVLAQVVLVGLTEHANGNVGEIEVRPLLFP